MTLLGLFQDAALSTTPPCPMRSFVISQIVPFAGQMVSKLTSTPVHFMRLLVNDRTMDLTHSCDQDNVSEKETLCETYGFLYGIEKLAKAGTQEFAKCGFVPADLWAKPKSKGAQVVAALVTLVLKFAFSSLALHCGPDFSASLPLSYRKSMFRARVGSAILSWSSPSIADTMGGFWDTDDTNYTHSLRKRTPGATLPVPPRWRRSV
ncbi:BQ5605_C003g02477 [Microbotryum silenes-dioicae]|uniref:BQ5605_C003g02477 protein n=1 Tax=Microbotryum silenes-dioicae TaxID=796604 RepID=A0A2X0MNY1_9BASI|nr:BQ5605_C003g02477 [Microbotryum silenes-dioicae]